jgi:hypothetical protein
MATDGESLLDKVKRLYTELFHTAMKDRVHSYHCYTDSNKRHEVSNLLHELIDEIVKEASNTHSPLEYNDLKLLDEQILSASDHIQHVQRLSVDIDLPAMSELSAFLASKIVHGNEEHLEDKLQRCVEEHVHAAHRYARSGRCEIAKLHADLATNAMKVLSHYMTVDDYSRFITTISSQLHVMGADLLKHSEPAST